MIRAAPTAGPPVALSTASVFPEPASAAFELAAELGYDGVELMVWTDPISQDVAAVARLAERHGMPVRAVHAPCLAVTQRVWGADPVRPAPPLGGRRRPRWSAGGRDAPAVPLAARLRRACSPTRSPGPDEAAGVALAVENMFPVGRGPLRAVPYRPGYDPTAVGYPHYTLDLSHTATAGSDALAMLDRMGDRLRPRAPGRRHRRPRDEHLVPGRGGQPCARGLRAAGDTGFRGAVVVEVSTRRCRTRDERAGLLHEALLFARLHLQPTAAGPVPAPAVTPPFARGRCGTSSRSATAGSPPQLGYRTGRSARRRTAGCCWRCWPGPPWPGWPGSARRGRRDPLAVAADFLRAPDPGPVELHTEVLRAGRTASVVARAAAAGRAADADRHGHRGPAAGRHHRCARSCRSWPRRAGGRTRSTRPRSTEVSGLARCCDLRWDPADRPFPRGEPGPPEVRGWARPRGEPTGVLFALLAGDILPPTVFNLGGERGWAPTVQLTALLRAHPAPGWLRLESTARPGRRRLVRRGRDRAGLAPARLICQARQLALRWPTAGYRHPMTRIAVLGAGKIGEALLSGLLAAGRTAAELVFTERHPERAAELDRPARGGRGRTWPTAAGARRADRGRGQAAGHRAGAGRAGAGAAARARWWCRCAPGCRPRCSRARCRPAPRWCGSCRTPRCWSARR